MQILIWKCQIINILLWHQYQIKKIQIFYRGSYPKQQYTNVGSGSYPKQQNTNLGNSYPKQQYTNVGSGTNS